MLAEVGKRHRFAESGPASDDEAELDLDVELARRAEPRRVAVEVLAVRAADLGPGENDRAGAAVVADRQRAPVPQQRLAAGPKQPAHVRRVLERGVEVDEIRHGERQMESDAVEWVAGLGSCIDRRDDPFDGAVPFPAAFGEEVVERHRRHDACSGEVEHLVAATPAESRHAVFREDAERH